MAKKPALKRVKRGERGRFKPGTKAGPGRPKTLPPPPVRPTPDDDQLINKAWFYAVNQVAESTAQKVKDAILGHEDARLWLIQQIMHGAMLEWLDPESIHRAAERTIALGHPCHLCGVHVDP